MSEQKYRALVESINDGILHVDNNDVIQFVNDRFCEMIGYTREELIGKIAHKMRWADKKGQPLIKQKIELRKKKAADSYEVQFQHKTGIKTWVSVSGSLVYGENGKIIGSLGIIKDITERTDLMGSLSYERDKFNFILDKLPLGVTVLDEKDKYVYINPKSMRIDGACEGRDDLYDKDVRTNHLGKSLQGVEKLLKNFKSGKSSSFTRVTKRGKADVEIAYHALRSEKGEYQGVIRLMRDISEQKKAEKTLKESEFILMESQRVAQLGSYITDFTVGAWKSSETLDNIFGIDENFERTIEGWLQIVHPESREELGAYLNDEVIAKQQKFNKEYRIVRVNDKKVRWVHGLGEVVFDHSGNILSMQGTIQDITERKEADKALRQADDILHEISSIVLLADNKGNVVFASPSIEKLTGYKPHEIMGNKWWKASFINEREGRRRKNELLEYANDPKRKYTDPYQRQIKCKDGSLKWFEWHNSKGTDNAIIGVGHDVTLRVIAENKLKTKTKELETFFYRSAHDLRAPFSTSAGLLNLIESANPNDEVRSYVDKLKITLNKAEALIQSLSLASMVSGKIVELQVIDFDKLIADTLQTLSGTTNYEAIDFDIDIKVSGKFNSSGQLLGAIFQNLLQNAIKYHRPANGKHKPFVKIGVRSIKAGVIITIQDNGQGIHKDYIDSIFNMYYRASESSKGTGLGLYIVKNAVAKLGGTIEVKSRLGKGTTFTVSLEN